MADRGRVESVDEEDCELADGPPGGSRGMRSSYGMESAACRGGRTGARASEARTGSLFSLCEAADVGREPLGAPPFLWNREKRDFISTDRDGR